MAKFHEFFHVFTIFSSSSSSSASNFFLLFLLLVLHLFFVSTTLVIAVNPITTIPFSRGFDPLFGGGNVIPSTDDRSVRLHLNKYTGSGFRSSDYYNHAIFSAKIKLPSEYTAGVVVAFYTTNQDIFTKTHDELDFEFLGNIKGKAWRFQTNMYGNGSTSRGREERYYLWFDPTTDFHRYTIMWTSNNIIFFIDDIPIREITHKESMGGDYPNKPMALYATIWDASDWATSGGKYKANYKYAPFIAEFTDLTLHGCVNDPLQQVIHADSTETDTTIDTTVTYKQRVSMKKFRLKYMYYSHCYDTLRYPNPLPECVIDPMERKRFKETGRVKFDKLGRNHSKRSKSSGFGSGVDYGKQEDE